MRSSGLSNGGACPLYEVLVQNYGYYLKRWQRRKLRDAMRKEGSSGGIDEPLRLDRVHPLHLSCRRSIPLSTVAEVSKSQQHGSLSYV